MLFNNALLQSCWDMKSRGGAKWKNRPRVNGAQQLREGERREEADPRSDLKMDAEQR